MKYQTSKLHISVIIALLIITIIVVYRNIVILDDFYSPFNDGMTFLVWSTVITTLVFCISITGIIMGKRWGIQLLLGISTLVMMSEITAPSFFPGNAMYYDFFLYTVIFAVLFVKKNEVSAWKVLLNSNTETKNKCSQNNTEAPNLGSNQDKKEGALEYTNYSSNNLNIFFDKVLADLDSKKEEVNDQKKTEEHIELTSLVQKNVVSEKKCSPNQIETKKIDCLKTNNNTQSRMLSSDSFRKIYAHLNLKVSLYIISAIAIITIAIVAVIHYSETPEQKFDRANALYNKGEIAKSVELLEKLASDEYVPAKARLGHLYLKSDKIESDIDKGFKYLEIAASTDNYALVEIMNIYMGEKCRGKEYTDYEKAKYYAEFALSKNISTKEAYFALGYIYSENNEHEKAYYYWEKAAKEGSADAYDNLGWMAYNGKGYTVNYEKAYEFFSKALEINKNDGYAQYYLGLMYLYGQVFNQDTNMARYYLKEAADHGNEDAIKEYAKLQMK